MKKYESPKAEYIEFYSVEETTGDNSTSAVETPEEEF